MQDRRRIGLREVGDGELPLQLDHALRVAGQLERVGVGPPLDPSRELVRHDPQHGAGEANSQQ
jgi:hypothetical protein